MRPINGNQKQSDNALVFSSIRKIPTFEDPIGARQF